MCEILSVNFADSGHRSRNVKSKLTKWGYAFDFPSKGNITITRQPESSEEKLNEILLRKMELDVQTKPLHFACFISAFQDIEGFESMPWEERAEQIATYYDIKSVCDRTLRNYCHKLLDKNLIGKVDERTCWKTEIIDSVKIRTPIQQGDKEMADYFSRKYELINELKGKCFSLGLRPKEANKIAWTEAMKILWQEFHCCYYTCKTFLFSAWEDDEEPFFQEVVELTYDIV